MELLWPEERRHSGHGFQEAQNRRSRILRSSVLWLTVSNVGLFVLSGLVLWSSRIQARSDQETWKAMSYFPPILERFDIPKISVVTNGTLYDTNPPSILRMRTGDEADAEWHRIGDHAWPLVISADDVRALDKDPEVAVRIPEELGYGSDAYIAQTEVFHHLHYLDMLRRETNYAVTTRRKRGRSQGVLSTRPISAIASTCRDFDALLEWVNANAMEPEVFQMMKMLPTGYAVLPAPDPALDVTGRIGEAFGLKGLGAIPSELLVRFRLLSPDTLLWRYLAPIELADNLTDSEQHELEELPLSCLLSWKRGEGVVKHDSKDLEPVIRIWIDEVGISSIERLSEPPTFARKGKENVACVLFENEEQYENIFAQLKIRTKFRGDIILGPWLEEPERLDLEDKVLNEGTGMTLIWADSGGSESPKAIYAHSRDPFWECGNIPAKKMGDDVSSGGNQGVMIEHKSWEGVTPFRVSQPRENPFMVPYMTGPYLIEERLLEPVYFSSVVADEIVTVEVFNKPTDKGPRFQGAIFYFSAGTAQAVGQCRVGIDSCEIFHDPMWIQWEQTPKVEGSGDDEDDHSDIFQVHPRLARLGFSSQTDIDVVTTSGWTKPHYLHSAELHFWFTASEVVLTVNAFPLRGRNSYYDVDSSSDGSHDDDNDDGENDESEDDQYYDDGDDEMEEGGGFS
ncbi:hypothetical protein DL770_010309 [Monosporascus sp. CRB-9-2]|nr:hypothetical protein DL770_010309 [Monosporascus sp. CRB-9-2]